MKKGIALLLALGLQVGCKSVEEAAADFPAQTQEPDNIEKRTDEVYQQMDSALARKDLPAFVSAYRRAIEFQQEIQDNPSPSATGKWMRLFMDTTTGIYGNIFLQAMSYPGILEQWPASCATTPHQGIREDLERYIRFVNNKRAASGAENGRWHWLTIFDNETLANSNQREVHPEANYAQNARFLKPGIFSQLDYSGPGITVLFSLYQTSRQGTSSRIERLCDIIDLGADGIDACDARLNLIDLEQIEENNRQYKGCLTQTLEKLQQRYAGSGLF